MGNGLSVFWNTLMRSVWGDPPKITEPEMPGQPGWLKLQFTHASDISKFEALFHDNIKPNIDPEGNVAMRKEAFFEAAIADGHAAYLVDDGGHARTTTIAYRTSLIESFKGHSPDFVELGTALTTVGGFGTAKVVSAALTLKEWWEDEPLIGFTAAIKADNAASLKTYTSLGWVQEEDQDVLDQIGQSCDQTIIPKDGAAAHKTAPENWFVPSDDAMAVKAQFLLELMDQGTLYNKKSDHHLPIDLSDLNRVGLTRERLEAIASGEMDRSVLRAIKPGHLPPSP